jgi:predicted nucleic acid-binding protein
VNRFVLDASVALAWFIDRPVSPYATRVGEVLSTGGRAVVPALWRVEVPNGLLVAEKCGVLSPFDTALAVEKFEKLLNQSIESIQDNVSLRRVLVSARQFQLTTYDACYLDLARDTQLPLATLDRQLGEAAGRAGVSLFS